jgi:uncharacterized RDD family membrane protein YckC
MVFAGLFARFLVVLADVVLLWTVLITAMYVPPWPPGLSSAIVFASWLVLVAAYFIALPATVLQGTLLQRAGRIKVTDVKGGRIGFGRSALRFVLSLMTLATGGIGFAAAAWTPRFQALHDYGARTVVVRRKATPEEIAACVAPSRWWPHRVLAIAALMALYAVACLPVAAYRQMHKRSQVWQAVGGATQYKDEVARALSAGGPIPPPPTNLPRHVRALYAKADGTVVVETAEHVEKEGRVLFRPERRPDGIAWRCSAEKIEQALLPNICRDSAKR